METDYLHTQKRKTRGRCGWSKLSYDHADYTPIDLNIKFALQYYSS